MKAKIILKAKMDKDGVIDNKIEMEGDTNVMINSLLDALCTVAEENNVEIEKIIEYIKNRANYLIEE